MMDSFDVVSPIVSKKVKKEVKKPRDKHEDKTKTKKSCFVRNWLLSSKDRSSTPIKDDLKKSSQSEVNVDPCVSELAGVASSDQSSVASGYCLIL